MRDRQELRNDIAGGIIFGALPGGSTLLSAVVQGKISGLNRETVQKAHKELAAQNLVSTTVAGSVVNETVSAPLALIKAATAICYDAASAGFDRERLLYLLWGAWNDMEIHEHERERAEMEDLRY